MTYSTSFSLLRPSRKSRLLCGVEEYKGEGELGVRELSRLIGEVERRGEGEGYGIGLAVKGKGAK